MLQAREQTFGVAHRQALKVFDRVIAEWGVFYSDTMDPDSDVCLDVTLVVCIRELYCPWDGPGLRRSIQHSFDIRNVLTDKEYSKFAWFSLFAETHDIHECFHGLLPLDFYTFVKAINDDIELRKKGTYIFEQASDQGE